MVLITWKMVTCFCIIEYENSNVSRENTFKFKQQCKAHDTVSECLIEMRRLANLHGRNPTDAQTKDTDQKIIDNKNKPQFQRR